MRKRLFLILGLLFIAAILYTNSAYAIPDLQLYIPGSMYVGEYPDPWITESWYTDESSFELWVIAGRTFSDLNLAMAVAVGESGTININSVSYSSFVYGRPIIGYKPNGKPEYLPGHGVYDTYYALHNIGPITELNEPISNMVDSTDPENSTKLGKIIKFNVVKNDFTKAHFDVFGDGKFAPFSHDAQDGPIPPPPVPEPATLSLLGLGILGLLGLKGLRRKM